MLDPFICSKSVLVFDSFGHQIIIYLGEIYRQIFCSIESWSKILSCDLLWTFASTSSWYVSFSKSASLAEPGCTFGPGPGSWPAALPFAMCFSPLCHFAFPETEMSCHQNFLEVPQVFCQKEKPQQSSCLSPGLWHHSRRLFGTQANCTCHGHLIVRVQISFSIMPFLSKEGFINVLTKAVPEICSEPVDASDCEDVAHFLYSKIKEAAVDEADKKKKRKSGKSNWASLNAATAAKRAREKAEVKPVLCDVDLAKSESPPSPKRQRTCKSPLLCVWEWGAAYVRIWAHDSHDPSSMPWSLWTLMDFESLRVKCPYHTDMRDILC